MKLVSLSLAFFSPSKSLLISLLVDRQTCLSVGDGTRHFPPCHMLELCGFRLLLECPLDLSALTIFCPLNPNPSRNQVEDDNNNADSLLKAVPWYKTLKNLHLWDPSLINAVLVSTPAGMLGLPFLTRSGKFSGKVYATEATAKIGRMMMEELVAMHSEYVQFYGEGEIGSVPEWMNWEEIERIPSHLREVLMGEHGEELGSWVPLYRYKILFLSLFATCGCSCHHHHSTFATLSGSAT